jgi:hypothetical protein
VPDAELIHPYIVPDVRLVFRPYGDLLSFQEQIERRQRINCLEQFFASVRRVGGMDAPNKCRPKIHAAIRFSPLLSISGNKKNSRQKTSSKNEKHKKIGNKKAGPEAQL